MIMIAHQDLTPVFPRLIHFTSKGAETAAIRRLGRDWRARGYRIGDFYHEDGRLVCRNPYL